MVLNPKIKNELFETLKGLENQGKLLPKKKLSECYALFKERFGPNVLAKMDGVELLEIMHAHGNKDSLVYWLEFKNDDELPAVFGGIGGGSALKFGIYKSNETNEWTTGTPSSKQTLTIEEAVKYARRHRDQLIKGCEIIGSLAPDFSDNTYRDLQDQMMLAAPDVQDTGWGHKYFYMMFPEKLDDFHSAAFQRFNLIKMLQIPPTEPGRYVSAGRFINIANELNVPVNHLTIALNNRNGTPYRYWRIGTRISDVFRWDSMREGNYVAVGWRNLDDLSWVKRNRESKERLKQLMAQKYPKAPQIIGRQTQQAFNFVAVIHEGDLVLSSDGMKVLGIGRVNGPYYFEPGSDYPHRRNVEWLSLDEWKMPMQEGLQTTVHEIRKFAENLINVESKIISKQPIVPPPINGIFGRIYDVLKRKSQVVLYGPPGTGKTFWAVRTAQELASRMNYQKSFDEIEHAEKNRIVGDETNSKPYLRLCCFHPEYGYEDFMEGYRPESKDGNVYFILKDGIFKKICSDAENEPEKTFFLIIDEINRGDIPRIFGELMSIMEIDKRGKELVLPLCGARFHVPPNIMIIGTMNTADRSIALLDTALRRRFGFIEFMPDINALEDEVIKGIPVRLWLKSLNRRICDFVGRDARNLQIGHSYFMHNGKTVNTFKQLSDIIRQDIIPLLEEYCYEDYNILEKLLGTALVDSTSLCIRDELFESSNEDELAAALLAPCPDISTSLRAIDSDLETPQDEENDDMEDSTESTGN